MDAEEKLKLARQKLFEAEEALDICLHKREYDRPYCSQLAENARVARDEFLDQLSKFWSEKQ